MDDDLGARLERFVGERLGAPVRVIHLERSTEGFSQETFVFEVEVGRERRGYVAKREPVAGLLEPYDLEPEFRVCTRSPTTRCPPRPRRGSRATRPCSSVPST